MKKFTNIILSLSVIASLTACKNDKPKVAEQGREYNSKTEKPSASLNAEETYPLDVPIIVNMHGSWKSVTDPKTTLEFRGDHWKMSKDGTVIDDATFKLYKHCPSKCFTEHFTTDGVMCFSLVGPNNMINCYLIRLTDGNNFNFSKIVDGESVEEKFVRVGQ
jgi:hypothetical protein